MKFVVTSLFILTAAIIGHAQQASPTPPADEVVKITSKLVQFDAVVTDSKGNQVTDLTANDFEIIEDGKPQNIKYFSYVNADPSAGPARSQRAVPTNGITPPSRPNSAVPGRIITFVVDDGNCLSSQLGMVASREALEKFIREQMQPGDRVAIYQTRAGSSIFQQYTSDKAVLLRAAKKVRWFPPIGPCSTAGGSFYAAARPNTYDKITPEGTVTRTIESEAERKIRESNEDFSRTNQVVGSVGVLRYVIRGLESAGGRKIVFFMSDGLPLLTRDGKVSAAAAALRSLTDAANRSSVVFNTIDVRGVFEPGQIEARDSVSTRDDAAATDKVSTERSRDILISRDGLRVLAEETGGSFYRDQNFLDVPVGRALNLEKGYYLLAYEPDDDSFKGKNFNRIEIRSKRPGLKVLSRAGYVGSVSEPRQARKRSADSDLYQAIAAPLPSAGLGLRLTAYFGHGVKDGNYVRVLTHLDGNSIDFVDDRNGMKTATIDVVAVTMNEKNDVVDEFNRKHTFKVEAAALPLIRQNGLLYTTDVPIKKPGFYNFRVAVRDVTTRLIGSASQMVEIPDMTKRTLLISGLTVTTVDANGKFSVPSAVAPENAISLIGSPAVPAVRQFRRGSVLAYAYTVYNARVDRATGKPRLAVQTNLYHDGNLISEGKPQLTQLEDQSDWSRIQDFGYLKLNAAVAPGDYAVQVIVTDTVARNASSSQWIDFEVVD